MSPPYVAMSDFSPVMKGAVVLGGVIALFVAVKVGQVMVRLLFGLMGLALIGGAIWWVLVKH